MTIDIRCRNMTPPIDAGAQAQVQEIMETMLTTTFEENFTRASGRTMLTTTFWEPLFRLGGATIGNTGGGAGPGAKHVPESSSP